MRKLISIISLGFVLGAVSCTKQEVSQQEQGVGMLSMDMSVAAQTRALSEDELYNTAKVNIYKADYSGLVRSYAYSEIPSPLYLAADKYRVDVIAGEAVAQTPAIASWDSKSYKGSQAFEIVANQVTTVQVVANVNNAVTKVAFDPTVAENFNPGYTMTMTLSDDAASSLVYDASKSGAEGYYIVAGLFEPSLTWTFTGTLAKDGSTFTKTGVIENVQPGKLYSMNLKYTIKDGDLVFSLVVDRTTEIVDDTIVFDPVSTGLAPSSIYEIWATRATVHADVDVTESEGKTIKFGYSIDGGSTWNYADGVNDSEGTWKADLSGLNPNTTYTYGLFIDDVITGETMTLTTDEAPMLPNGSFEYASYVDGENFYKFYDPDCGVEEGSYKFWASGNGDEEVSGSAKYSVITTIDTNEKVHGNQSVLAQSQYAVIKFAAGNIFTGTFAGLVGTEGGKVNFGRPWTSRPTALKLYCKYTTDVINRIDKVPAGENIVKNQTLDEAEIKFALGYWPYNKYGGSKDSPVQVNTTMESTFIDYNNDPYTIAYGNLILHKDGYELNGASKVEKETSQWQEYIIPLDYHTTTVFPTHIIVSAASSRFGDYFTGCDTSKLWIDAVELIY